MKDLSSLSLFVSVFSGSSSAANSLSGDGQGTYCAIPAQSVRTTRDNTYRIGFSAAPVFSNPHGFPTSWKESCYGTNRPNSRNSMHSFSRMRTLPSYFSQQHYDAAAGSSETPNQCPNIVTVASAFEVATMFWIMFDNEVYPIDVNICKYLCCYMLQRCTLGMGIIINDVLFISYIIFWLQCCIINIYDVLYKSIKYNDETCCVFRYFVNYDIIWRETNHYLRIKILLIEKFQRSMNILNMNYLPGAIRNSSLNM